MSIIYATWVYGSAPLTACAAEGIMGTLVFARATDDGVQRHQQGSYNVFSVQYKE